MTNGDFIVHDMFLFLIYLQCTCGGLLILWLWDGVAFVGVVDEEIKS